MTAPSLEPTEAMRRRRERKMERERETAEVLADRDFWRAIGALADLKLYGFTYRDSAAFHLPSGGLVEFSRPHVRAIEAARARALMEQDAAARREGHAATLAVIDTEYRRLSSLANHAMSPAVAQAIHDAGVIRDLGDRIRALEPGEGTT